jgi:hypothetical protein
MTGQNALPAYATTATLIGPLRRLQIRPNWTWTRRCVAVLLPWCHGCQHHQRYAWLPRPCDDQCSGTVSKELFGLGKVIYEVRAAAQLLQRSVRPGVAPKPRSKRPWVTPATKWPKTLASRTIDYSVGCLRSGQRFRSTALGWQQKSSYLYAIDSSRSINRATLVMGGDQSPITKTQNPRRVRDGLWGLSPC